MKGQLRALVRLEYRRGLGPNLRLIGLFAVGTTLMVTLGWMSPSRLGWLLALVATTFLMQVPMGVLRDKLDGGLEFLVTLPASPGDLAVGRLLAAAAACVPGALGLLAAVRLWFPTQVAALPGGLVGAFGLLWITTTLVSALLVAIAFRFEARTTLYVPIGLGLVGVVTDELAPGLVPHPLEVVDWLTRQGWPTGVFWGAGGLSIALVAWLAYRMARSGIERFEPGRDRITW